MASVYLIYTHYYNFNTHTVSIGGVQTYIQHLCDVYQAMGFSCKIYQAGENLQEEELRPGVRVVEVDTGNCKSRTSKMECIVEKIEETYCDAEDMLVFLANEITCKNKASKSIALQHGISWDSLYKKPLSKLRNIAHFAIKAKNAYGKIERLQHVKRLVCVDHNFPNWLRSTAIRCNTAMTVIPNFTDIAPLYTKPDGRINIIFARRFFDYRGTRVFAPAIKRILESYDNVYVTLAGTGPDEAYMLETLKTYADRVEVIQYAADEALTVHSDQHIAVIPTMGSEGTSLSLLEAMSAQCAVVCTDVGGLSNIILDGYNGVFAEPEEEALAKKIAELIDDGEKRKALATKAYETVKGAFSLDIWKARWKEVITEMMGDSK